VLRFALKKVVCADTTTKIPPFKACDSIFVLQNFILILTSSLKSAQEVGKHSLTNMDKNEKIMVIFQYVYELSVDLICLYIVYADGIFHALKSTTKV